MILHAGLIEMRAGSQLGPQENVPDWHGLSLVGTCKEQQNIGSWQPFAVATQNHNPGDGTGIGACTRVRLYEFLPSTRPVIAFRHRSAPLKSLNPIAQRCAESGIVELTVLLFVPHETANEIGDFIGRGI